MGVLCGFPLSVLCLMFVVCAMILFAFFIAGKTTLNLILCVYHREYREEDGFHDVIMDVKGKLERFFTACRREIMKCFSPFSGCDRFTHYLYQVSLYAVLSVAVALACLLVPLFLALILVLFVAAGVFHIPFFASFREEETSYVNKKFRGGNPDGRSSNIRVPASELLVYIRRFFFPEGRKKGNMKNSRGNK